MLSFDIGYSYRERAFNNKNDIPPFLKYLFKPPSDGISTYNINKKENLQGLSIGFSNIVKLYKQLSFGLNINYDILKVHNTYQLNYYVSGDKVYDPITEKDIELPYAKTYTKTWQELPNFLIKIIYEIN